VRPVLSLRTRVLLGALLWSIGLFLAAGFALTHYMLYVPEAPGIFHGFFVRHMVLVLVLTFACLVLGLAEVRRGLASFDQLRRRLVSVRDGSQRRLAGDYPAEVQPLVSDLNDLLADREQRVARALTKAGDLAHGLKTPLTILNQYAQQTRTMGQVELSNALMQQLERMRRQVEYHLAQARASAAGANSGARSQVMTSADALARTMLTLHAGRGVNVAVDVEADHFVRVQREDLEEMLGNLIDNACKWAKSSVRIFTRPAGGTIAILVDDDGPGIEPALREKVLQRGVRADQAAPGSGLGLAIVAELADLYGGTIELASSEPGGLRVILRLPAA
jgi:signal transduction histidine kinase